MNHCETCYIMAWPDCRQTARFFLSLQIIPGLSNEYIGGGRNFGYCNCMIMRTVCIEAQVQVTLLTKS